MTSSRLPTVNYDDITSNIGGGSGINNSGGNNSIYGSVGNNGNTGSTSGGEDRQNQRKKEVEDLITKYTKKKEPSEVKYFFA